MMYRALSLTARVGAITLLVSLCRLQASPLMSAALSGNLSVAGWILLVFLVVTGAACTLELLVSPGTMLFTLILVASGDIGETLIRKLHDADSAPRRR